MTIRAPPCCCRGPAVCQLAKPRSHTVIECSETVIARLKLWAADNPSVRIVEGTWQRRLADLGVFDRIFFDDYGDPGICIALWVIARDIKPMTLCSHGSRTMSCGSGYPEYSPEYDNIMAPSTRRQARGAITILFALTGNRQCHARTRR